MTDPSQASEADKAVVIGSLYGIQSDILPADEVRHRIAGFKHTQGYKEAIELIRTEKLKLLDEVRERVVAEEYPEDVMLWTPDGNERTRVIKTEDAIAVLTKLEAEL